jgi:hypothetical protein
MVAGGIVASQVSGILNEQIAEQVSAAAAGLGQQLTSTAVVSCGRLTITPAGVSAVMVLGDLFGPGLVPVPKTMSVEVSPRWQCASPQDYTVTVRELIHGTPVPGASVQLKTGAGATGGPGPKTSTGTTDANGRAELEDVTLRGWVMVHPGPPGDPPVTVQFDPVLAVSASGFHNVLTAIHCPAV